MTKKKNDPKSKLRNYARFSGIVFEMLVIIGGGTWGGHKIDQGRGTEFPLFTVIFSLCSVFIALFLVIRQVNNETKE